MWLYTSINTQPTKNLCHHSRNTKIKTRTLAKSKHKQFEKQESTKFGNTMELHIN